MVCTRFENHILIRVELLGFFFLGAVFVAYGSTSGHYCNYCFTLTTSGLEIIPLPLKTGDGPRTLLLGMRTLMRSFWTRTDKRQSNKNKTTWT